MKKIINAMTYIIVLVDEDVEAYFNGTLVFYDKNNLPQPQW